MPSTELNMQNYGVAWYKMNETSGTVLSDSKGTNDGAINGSPVFNGNSITFDGVNDYVTFSTPILPVGAKSIRFPIKSTATKGWIMRNGINTNSGWAIIQTTTGSLRVFLFNSGTVAFDIETPTNLSDGLLHDVLFRFDGSYGELFVDNMTTPVATGAMSGNEPAPSYNLNIGTRTGLDTENFLNAEIGSIEIYNHFIGPIVNKTLILTDTNTFTHDGTSVLDLGANPADPATLKALAQSDGFEDESLVVDVVNHIGAQCTIYVSPGDEANPPLNAVPSFIPPAQISIPTSLKDVSTYERINSLTVTQNASGTGINRYAISRDGSEWFVWDAGVMTSIGTLTADTAGAEKLITQGMSAAILNALDWAQLNELYNFGSPDNIAIAYAQDISALTDVAENDKGQISANTAGTVQPARESEVDIEWNNNTVKFTANVSSDFVYNYQTP